MRILALLPLLLLAGCRTVPVSPDFPTAPATLQEKCAKLQEATEGMPLTEFTKVVVQNYILYRECERKVEGWNEWYIEQKKIYEKAGKKKWPF